MCDARTQQLGIGFVFVLRVGVVFVCLINFSFGFSIVVGRLSLSVD